MPSARRRGPTAPSRGGGETRRLLPQAVAPGPHGPPEPSGSRSAVASETEIALDYPLRPDLLAQVIVPRDLTVEEARRMGAFLVTLAVDFRPAGAA